jgi:hypothetical protein
MATCPVEIRCEKIGAQAPPQPEIRPQYDKVIPGSLVLTIYPEKVPDMFESFESTTVLSLNK